MENSLGSITFTSFAWFSKHLVQASTIKRLYIECIWTGLYVKVCGHRPRPNGKFVLKHNFDILLPIIIFLGTSLYVQARVKWIFFYQSNTSTSFVSFSCHLAQVSTITRPCLPYMTQVCPTKVKVTGKGQMENLFLEHIFHSCCWIYHLTQVSAITKQFVTYKTQICNPRSRSKAKVKLKMCFMSITRPLDKSVYRKIIYFISHPKHMLWVLKRTVSMRRFFWAPKTHV